MARFGIGVVASCLKRPDPAATVAAAKLVGVECLQVYNRRPEGVTARQWAETWLEAIRGSGVALASAVTGFAQEDYSSIAAIHRTGGLVPDPTAEANVERVFDALDFAQCLGVDLLTFHVGFIPEDVSDPVFGKLVERLGRCADAAAGRGVRIGLESGQETAGALRRFLAALGRDNVGCNFDPGNLILYGNQPPIDALAALSGCIFQVHAKDATWSEQPGVAWGREVPLGRGQVDFPRLLERLLADGFAGNLIIEREAGQEPLTDIAGAVGLLRTLRGDLDGSGRTSIASGRALRGRGKSLT